MSATTFRQYRKEMDQGWEQIHLPDHDNRELSRTYSGSALKRQVQRETAARFRQILMDKYIQALAQAETANNDAADVPAANVIMQQSVYPRYVVALFFVGLAVFIVGFLIILLGQPLLTSDYAFVAWLIMALGGALVSLMLIKGQEISQERMAGE